MLEFILNKQPARLTERVSKFIIYQVFILEIHIKKSINLTGKIKKIIYQDLNLTIRRF